MSDKAIEQTRKEFDKAIESKLTEVLHVELAWLGWQAAKELYAPRESEGSIILKYLKGKLDSHCEDFAYNEIDTNAVVFSTRESEDYANNLEEIIDEIEELIATKAMDIGESE